MSKKNLLEPEKYFHVYNHAIGFENLFNHSFEYKLFLSKYQKYFCPIADTLAYCLMPNHYHFCLRIKDETVIRNFDNDKSRNVCELIYRNFANFLNSYVQTFNKINARMGGLFVGNFKRKELPYDDDIRRAICYINKNPVEANIVKKPDDYLYSSYNSVISNYKWELIPICRDEITRLFNDLENFKYLHTLQVESDTLR